MIAREIFPRQRGGLRIGVDIGGNFTDLVFLSADGRLDKLKVASTPDDYSRAITQGIDHHLAANPALGPKDVAEIVHATTVATNAILERKGARTALVTTAGFRDVLELRRIRIPFSYDLSWDKPAPLAERALRFEVAERIDPNGEILIPLDLAILDPLVARLEEEDVEAIAVCLLHSYKNPVHEQALGKVLRSRLPGVNISLSYEVLPEIKEFERTSTCVVNAYVGPTIERYLSRLRETLSGGQVEAPVLVMQSNGGLIPSRTAAREPVKIIESGPAAGVIAALELAKFGGYANVITLDMGGTTTKASIIEDGEILRASEYEVGSPISVGSRLVRGSGYLLRIPVIDISEVGAGGGSLAEIDSGGALRVGPRSAGATPGPACYGLGNDLPTVTDANLVLGYLHPTSLAGGALAIDRGLAAQAIAQTVAEPSGLPLEDAAHGVHLIVNSNMVRAINSVSVERGRDPTDFVLMAFGGAGPLHACGVAAELGIRTVLVPPAPGLLSAFGLLRAEVEHHTVRTVLSRFDSLHPTVVAGFLIEMRTDLLHKAGEEEFAESAVSFQAAMDVRYSGQSSEITVPAESLVVGDSFLDDLAERFENHARIQEDAHPVGHLGVVVLPAAMAVAEQIHASGADLIAAVVVGYECALRIGRDHAADLSDRGFHTTSVYGPIGAAAAARLYRLAPDKVAHAMGLGMNLAGGLREFAAPGGEEYALQAGVAARNGVVAAACAREGLHAAGSVLDGTAGFFPRVRERHYELWAAHQP